MKKGVNTVSADANREIKAPKRKKSSERLREEAKRRSDIKRETRAALAPILAIAMAAGGSLTGIVAMHSYSKSMKRQQYIQENMPNWQRGVSALKNSIENAKQSGLYDRVLEIYRQEAGLRRPLEIIEAHEKTIAQMEAQMGKLQKELDGGERARHEDLKNAYWALMATWTDAVRMAAAKDISEKEHRLGADKAEQDNYLQENYALNIAGLIETYKEFGD